jgi:UDP-N-acetylmuramate dehydrogenase
MGSGFTRGLEGDGLSIEEVVASYPSKMADSRRMQLARDVLLGPMTTFGLGGPASHVAVIERESDVAEALEEADRLGLPAVVLGGGSNVVVADEGLRALVLHMQMRGIAPVVEGEVTRVTLQAGEPWDAFVGWAVEAGLAGVECLAGIPGLAGATPIQNVGAYGQETSDTLSLVHAFDRVSRERVVLDRTQCAFGYRTSLFKADPRYVVTAVTLSLRRDHESGPIVYPELARALGVEVGQRAPTARVRETVVALRRQKGMVLDPADSESKSAGSFFTNPIVDAAGLARVDASARGVAPPRYDAGDGRWKVPAAWLIEQAGFARGFTLGHVRVSKRHTLALVNDGEGTTRELLALAALIGRTVQERFGVTLTPEPVLLGATAPEAPGPR